MRHIASDKYSVAWFKLAECVARGEKERALGVYRLLAHSLEDQAFASQLAADLLWAFDDEQAITEYEYAAQLYKKDNRLLEATALYEHLITLMPKKELYREKNIELFIQLGKLKQAERSVLLFLDLMLENNNYEKAHQSIKQLEAIADIDVLMPVYQKMFFAVMCHENVSEDIIMYHLHKSLDCLLASRNDKQLQLFLARLQDQDDIYFTQAQNYLKDNH